MDYNPTTGVSLNDRYAMTQQGLTTNASGAIVTTAGAPPTAITLAQKQKAEIDIGHIDCDTIPFMWRWAKNFVLFDNFHQTIVGPSTPNAIALIAGQSGQTQWALHNDQGASAYANRLPECSARATASQTNAQQSPTATCRSSAIPARSPAPTSTRTRQAALQFRRERGQPVVEFDLRDAAAVVHGGRHPGDQSPTTRTRPPICSTCSTTSPRSPHFDPPVNWGWYQQGFNANDAPDPIRAARHGHRQRRQEPEPGREHRLCPAPQRSAIFRLSRRQSRRC